MLMLLIKGLIIGFAIAAPVGPIGILCIQRSLHEGFKIGLATGLGAATADGFYGIIAGFGLTAVSSLLIAHQFWIRFIGGLFLIYLGIKLIITAHRLKTPPVDSERSPWHAYVTTFMLTLANPMTILSFIAIFAGLGLGSIHPGYLQAMVLVLGIILGSAAWWLLLSGGVAYILHRRINAGIMHTINIISGLIILIFGIFALKI